MMKCNEMLRRRPLNLHSRGGSGYMVLTVLMLGFCITLMSIALDGLGLAVTYRRALGLATAGAQSGAGQLAMFAGGAVELAGSACDVARQTVQASLQSGAGGGATGANARVTCHQSGNALTVDVELKPLKFIGGPLAIVVDTVKASAKASPRYGINHEE